MAELCPPHYDRPRLETYKMAKYIVDVTADQIPPPDYLRNIDWSTKHINFKMVLQSNQDALKLRKERLDQKANAKDTELPKLKSFEINPLELSAWPSADELGMDMPQYSAFQSAITQELAIIQGPPGIVDSFATILSDSLVFLCLPGTGKTYIGLQIMKLLLANSLGTSESPILVVCYTSELQAFCKN